MHLSSSSLGSTAPLYHDFQGRLNQTVAHRKQREAHVHTALNRISLLEEAEARARRAVLQSREKVKRAAVLRTSLPPMSPLSAGVATLPPPMTSPLRPGPGSAYHAYGAAGTYGFGPRPVSPVRLAGLARPAASHEPLGERQSAVLEATRALKYTMLQAEAEGRAAEAAALRAEKDFRLHAAGHTRAMVYANNKAWHDSMAAQEAAAREQRRLAERDADARRRSNYDSRVAAHEMAHGVAEARLQRLEEIEAGLLQRLRGHTSELLHQQAASTQGPSHLQSQQLLGASSRSSSFLPTPHVVRAAGSATAAGLAVLAAEPASPTASRPFGALASQPMSRGRSGGRMPLAGINGGGSVFSPLNSLSGGGSLLSSYLGAGGSGWPEGGASLSGHSRSMVLPQPARSSSVPVSASGTRRRLQSSGPSYAIF